MQELVHARPRVPELEPAHAAQLVDEGAVIPDVRDSDEFSPGRARGAFPIPFGALGERLGEVLSDRPVIVVCRSGGAPIRRRRRSPRGAIPR